MTKKYIARLELPDSNRVFKEEVYAPNAFDAERMMKNKYSDARVFIHGPVNNSSSSSSEREGLEAAFRPFEGVFDTPEDHENLRKLFKECWWIFLIVFFLAWLVLQFV